MPAARKAKLTTKLERRSPTLAMASMERGGQFADDGETFDEFVEPFEVRADEAVEIGGRGTGDGEAVREVMSAQVIDNAEGLIAPAGRRLRGRRREACWWSCPWRKRPRWGGGAPGS